MTNKEERPAGCVLRLFGVPEQTVQKAVETLPDTWQGTVHCRTRGAETLVALQSSTPQQLHRAVQQLRTSLAPALYGEGEQTLAAAAVQALEQHRKLLVCSDAAAGALLETRLENLPGAEKVFDFGAMSYANAALTARLSRKLRKAPQAEPARTLARVQAMQKLTGAALAVGCVELPQSRLLLALGAAKAAGADIAVSVTGLAGPGGGDAVRPVGTVYLGAARGDKVYVKKLFVSRPDRALIRARAAQTALELALRLAQGKTPAGTQVLAESAQHDPAALTALDETLRAE